jgi:hypothetical protein
MVTQSWKTVLALVSAVAALAAVVLVVAAARGDTGWSAVVGAAGVAVLSAVPALLADREDVREDGPENGRDTDREGRPLAEGRHQ